MEKKIFATKGGEGKEIIFRKYVGTTSGGGSGYVEMVKQPVKETISSIELGDFLPAFGLYIAKVTFITDQVDNYLVEWNDGVF